MIGKLAGEGIHFYKCLTYNASPDKCEWEEYRNLAFADSVEAAKQMRRTAEHRREGVDDPLFHYVISWSKNDHPTKEQMLEVADRWLMHMELEDYQAQIASHIDKPYAHMHLAINRIHPKEHTAWDRWKYKSRSEALIKELEKEFGWELVPGKLHPQLDIEFDGRAPEQWEHHQQEKIKQAAASQGVDPGSVDGRSILQRVKDIEKELFQAESFREFDQTLDKKGLWLDVATNKKGMVISDGSYHIKASDVSRQLSGPRLEKKYGRRLKNYIDWREQQINQQAGVKLITDWKQNIDKQELQTLHSILQSKEQKANYQASRLRQLDGEFNRRMQAVMGRINEGIERAYADSKQAQQSISGFLAEQNEEVRFERIADALINDPEQFGTVSYRSGLIDVSEAFREAEHIREDFGTFFKGLGKQDRQALLEKAKGRVEEVSLSLRRVKYQLQQQGRDMMNESEAGQALAGTYYESLSIYRATKAISQYFSTPKVIQTRNRDLDERMAQALIEINKGFEQVFEHPGQAKDYFNEIAWFNYQFNDSGQDRIAQLEAHPASFGEVKNPGEVRTLAEQLRQPEALREQYRQFLSNLPRKDGKKTIQQYFQELPKALASRPAREGGMLSVARELNRWLSKASGSEAGRVVFSMGAKAVRYSKAVAKMLSAPKTGGLSIVQGMIKDSIKHGQSYGRSRDQGQELER